MSVALGLGWWLSLFALVVPASALAQGNSEVLTVRTTVRSQCRVQADDLDLGQYDPHRSSHATSSIQVQCTPGVLAQIGLNGGGTGDPMNRAMRDKGELHYQLYKDEARTQVFADRNASEMQSLLATGLTQRIQVHGEIPAGQAMPEGVYIDVVVVTVTY
jgi:spore coat protein U-like protein